MSFLGAAAVGGDVRAFISVRVPPQALPGPAGWDAETHLTLRFLGEVDETAVPATAGAMGRAARRISAFPVELAGLGEFVGPGRRVLWIGVGDGRRELAALHEALATELERIGVPPEPRPFRPHVTVRRIRSAADGRTADGLLRAFPDRTFGRLRVGALDLWASLQGPTGTRHLRLARQTLLGAEDDLADRDRPATAGPSAESGRADSMVPAKGSDGPRGDPAPRAGDGGDGPAGVREPPGPGGRRAAEVDRGCSYPPD